LHTAINWDIAGERARPGGRFRRRARFVPQGQPEISQTRSVWFIVQSKSVLKGRRNPSSFQDGQIYRMRYQPLCSWLISIASLRDFAAFAPFARQNSIALCPVRPPQTAIGRCLRTATNWDFAGERARPGGRFRRRAAAPENSPAIYGWDLCR